MKEGTHGDGSCVPLLVERLWVKSVSGGDFCLRGGGYCCLFTFVEAGWGLRGLLWIQISGDRRGFVEFQGSYRVAGEKDGVESLLW